MFGLNWMEVAVFATIGLVLLASSVASALLIIKALQQH